jgi:CubicO group peptidase (beta-lactamase class C family)
MRGVAFALLLAGCAPIVDRSLGSVAGTPLMAEPVATPLATRLDAIVPQSGGGIDALMVLRDGHVAHAVGPVDRPVNMASVRKSVLSLLYGAAAERGLVDLDRTIAGLDVDEPKAPLTEIEATATIRDLLAARSGIYLPADAEGADERPPRGRDHPAQRSTTAIGASTRSA